MQNASSFFFFFFFFVCFIEAKRSVSPSGAIEFYNANMDLSTVRVYRGSLAKVRRH